MSAGADSINLDTGQFQQLGHLGFPAQGHDVHALAVRTALSDDLGGDLHAGDAGLGPLLVGGQSFDHVVRHMDTGHVAVHELAHAGVLGDDHAQLHRLAKLLGGFHKLDELFRLKHGLGSS